MWVAEAYLEGETQHSVLQAAILLLFGDIWGSQCSLWFALAPGNCFKEEGEQLLANLVLKSPSRCASGRLS